jgi:hypothetical protein
MNLTFKTLIANKALLSFQTELYNFDPSINSNITAINMILIQE